MTGLSGRSAAISLSALLMAGVAAPALAQQQPPEPEASEEDTQVEDLVVTGSRVRGVAAVGSNVIAVSGEDLVELPASNVVEALRRLPQMAGTGSNEASKTTLSATGSVTNPTRTSSINLRGVGGTLVLYDGQRVPGAGVRGSQTDLTSLPMISLQRVEVVADGASAIYGSDAVTGVVNFIPRSRFDGGLTRGRVGFADGYQVNQISHMQGLNWENGGLVIAAEHVRNGHLNGRERDYYSSDLRSRGGGDYRSTQCATPNMRVGGVNYAIPATGVTPATASSLLPNTINRCDVFPLGDILAEQERNSVYFNISQDVNDWLRLNFRAVGFKRDYQADDIAQGSTTYFASFTVPSTNAFFVRPPATAGAVTLDYFFGDDNNQLKFTGYNHYYQLFAGGDVDLPYDWKARLQTSWGRTTDRVSGVNFLTSELTARLASSDPAYAFDPFSNSTPAAKAAILTNLFAPYNHNILRTNQINANGKLFDLPGGTVRLAVGYDHTTETVKTGSYRGAISAPAHTLTIAERTVKAAYAEAFAPLVSEANALPGIRRLELNIAARTDEYSDFGRTTNPKYGINYSPVDGLLFKATYGTSFTAPDGSVLASPRSGASFIVYTTNDPLSPTGFSTGLNWTDGNPALEPTTAESRSFSVQWQPKQIEGLSLSVTRFALEQEGSIVSAPAATALTDPNYAYAVTRNPTNAEVAALRAANPGLGLQGVLPNPVAFIVDTRPRNTGGFELSGYDFELSYARDHGFGVMTYGLSGSYVDKYTRTITNSAAPDDLRNILYSVMKLRMRGELGWQKGPWSADAFVSYVNSYNNTQVTPVQKVDSLTTLDLRGAYEFGEANKYLSGVTASLEVTNAFDTDPPFVNVATGGVDPSVASLVGRMVSVTLSKSW